MERNLLLVEDDKHIGELLYTSVKGLNTLKTIELSTTLKEAKSKLLNVFYDIIVLDLSLPDGNGIQLLKWLNKKNVETKVFIFSMNTELKRMCLQYGASAFFDKANDFDSLIDTISNDNSKINQN
ncbi:response regulator [Polaribacter aestuariivivens]|uniref:Response regulator n=1 Tax=Polaribacter aestuariivivens TaxID=2304626 RepID=A0A5S3N7D8_9FLAO|nr:response regulator [Polaribacter aestuariivivens]TMM31213.1 response regulator [Polaribacter aestuariivivens]